MAQRLSSQSFRRVECRFNIGMEIELKIISVQGRSSSFNPCGICLKGLNAHEDAPPFNAPGD